MKKYTIDFFKKDFNDKGYNLLTNEYINQNQYFEFTCNKHLDSGIQKIKVSSYLNKNGGCHQCAKERQLNRDRFPKDKAKTICYEKGLIFVDIKYGRELGKSTSLIYFKCPKHLYTGVQKMSLNQLLNKKTNGCNYCNFVLDTYTFKEKLERKNIDYFNVIGEFVDLNTHIELECKKHGVHYLQKPRKIFEGKNNCPECRKEKCTPEIIPKDEIQKRIYQNYPMIDIVGEYKNIYTPVDLYCKNHNFHFQLSVNNYLYKGKGCCCPKCVRSVGEEKIASVLDNLKIKYIEQKSFKDCKNVQSLLFDFYLPDNNICIEYQGQQHYYPIEHFGGKDRFEEQVQRDLIKKEYCKNNNIILIEVPYWEKDNLECFLWNELIKYGAIVEVA